MDTDVASIVGSYKFTDAVSLSALWMRPVNDNFTGDYFDKQSDRAGYLDNMDLFAVSLPSPWMAMR